MADILRKLPLHVPSREACNVIAIWQSAAFFMPDEVFELHKDGVRAISIIVVLNESNVCATVPMEAFKGKGEVNASGLTTWKG